MDRAAFAIRTFQTGRRSTVGMVRGGMLVVFGHEGVSHTTGDLAGAWA